MFSPKSTTGHHIPSGFHSSPFFYPGPDVEDKYLCPVRALKRYLLVTRCRHSSGLRRLFISLNQGYKKDIRATTLARWVSEVVVKGYATTGLLAPSHRAHEHRAWSASLALTHSVPLKSILEAAYWRSEGTFIHFYLRGSRRLREDGSTEYLRWSLPSAHVSLNISSIELRLSSLFRN